MKQSEPRSSEVRGEEPVAADTTTERIAKLELALALARNQERSSNGYSTDYRAGQLSNRIEYLWRELEKAKNAAYGTGGVPQ